MTSEQPSPSTPPPPPRDALHAIGEPPAVRRLSPRAVGITLMVLAFVVCGPLIMSWFGGDDRQPGARRSNDGSLSRPAGDPLDATPIGLLPSDYRFLRSQEPEAKPEPAPVEPPPELPTCPPCPEVIVPEEDGQEELLAALDSPIAFSKVHAQKKPTTNMAASSKGPAAAPESADAVASHLQQPASPYVVRAGSIIPAALVTAINSDLPGHLVGQVTANVYDSVTGRHLLVPQGSRLVGEYDSEVRKGQNRVLVTWHRLLLPDGSSIGLGDMPGTDAAGVAGLADRVDYHIDRIGVATAISTLITLGGHLASDLDRTKSPLDVANQAVSEQASQLGQRVIDRELDIAPTITVRAGMPFNVLVIKDLPLRPYKPVSNPR